MPVAVFTHPDCLRHDPGPDHPETPGRLGTLLDRLRREPGAALHDAAPADRSELIAVHRESYLRSVEALSAAGGGALFLDTILNRWSWPAAIGAAGAAIAAVDHAHGREGARVRRGTPARASCPRVRRHGILPPQQRRRRSPPRAAAGREQVLIVDWDVHHGNGTQALVETRRHDPLRLPAPVAVVSRNRRRRRAGCRQRVQRAAGPGAAARALRGDLWAAVVAATTGGRPIWCLFRPGSTPCEATRSADSRWSRSITPI